MFQGLFSGSRGHLPPPGDHVPGVDALARRHRATRRRQIMDGSLSDEVAALGRAAGRVPARATRALGRLLRRR